MSSQAEAVRVLDPVAVEAAHSSLPYQTIPSNSQADGFECSEGDFVSLAVSGGFYLSLRYGLGVLISIGNMFVLTWWIGPHAYGVFVTAVGLSAFLASLTRSGMDTYLVRRAESPDDRMYHVASTVILVMAMLLLGTGVLLVPLLTRWYASREFVPAYLAMLLTIPLVALSGPPTAKLERALNFRAVAQIELGGQLLALMVSLVLAWRGLGVWAPVAGHLTWQLFVVTGASVVARYIPRLRFDAGCIREMLSFGVGYTASLRTWQLRTLVNPLLVGRFVGAEGVAFVGLAIRVAEGLGFLRIAAARLAIAALARVQEDRDKFRTALESALRMQVLVLGPLLCTFAWLGPWVVPRLMGLRWAPSLQIYPFVAAGVLVNSVFNLQASALFVIGQQWVVMKSYASHVLLLAFGTFLLIPRVGLTAYGWADVGACTAYVFLQAGVSRMIGISYRRLLPWLIAFMAPLFVSVVRHPWSLALCLPLLGMGIASLRRWRWSSGSAGKARSRHDLTNSSGTQHFLTFYWKARQRGWRYVAAVFLYAVRSRSYRLRMVLERWLNIPAELHREYESCNVANVAASSVLLSRKFHFTSADIPAIVRSIPESLKQKTIAEAQRVLENRFLLRGREYTFSGKVDWTCPQKDLSWHWDLNRHRYFVSLGTAYYYTGKAAYLTRLLELWEDWIVRNPAAGGRTWRYPFEVAARLQNWIWAYVLLQYSGKVEEDRLAQLAKAMREHSAFLYSNLEYHWPNNHLLLEAKALYEWALLFPEFGHSARFLKRAKRVLTREVLAQVLSDGAHSELCSMYHRIVGGELLELATLCDRNSQPLPSAVERRIQAMGEFSRALLRPDGSMPLLGDSALNDSYMRFDLPSREDSDLNYWVWRNEQGASFARDQASGVSLQIFPDAGYAVVRGGAGDRGFHLTFDFGPFSRSASANHAHADALSFELHSGRRALIVDPGIYYARGDGARWARHLRSTAAHNTVVVDGREQSELCRYADVRRRARTRLLHHCISADEVVISAACMPYWGGDEGISHTREICASASGRVAVRDQVSGSARHRLEWFFQFGAALEAVQWGASTLVLRVSGSDLDLLILRPVASTAPSLALARGQTDPLRGWISCSSTEVVPAYVAVYSAEVELPFSIAFELELLSETPVLESRKCTSEASESAREPSFQ